MHELKEIKLTPKSGKEALSYKGDKIGYCLINFWQWSVSDLISNATRGRFAEFIVGSAVGFNVSKLRKEWDAFDIESHDGIKIEVKSASYIQSWRQKKLSYISFSIKASRHREGNSKTSKEVIKRHADVYVFCHLKHRDKTTIDPLKMEQWDFYVLPTCQLDDYERSQSSITLNSLQKLTAPRNYTELKDAISKAYKKQRLIIKNSLSR